MIFPFSQFSAQNNNLNQLRQEKQDTMPFDQVQQLTRVSNEPILAIDNTEYIGDCQQMPVYQQMNKKLH